MLTVFGRLIAGVRKKERTAPRRLSVEPLESRTVLSVVSLGAPVFPANPPLVESLPGLVDTDFAAKREFRAEPAAEGGKHLDEIDFSRADGLADGPAPQPVNETTASSLPLPGQARHQFAGPVALGKANSGPAVGIEWPHAVTPPMPAPLSASPGFSPSPSTDAVADHLTSPGAPASLQFQPPFVSTSPPGVLGHGRDTSGYVSVAYDPENFSIASSAEFSAVRPPSDSAAPRPEPARWLFAGVKGTDEVRQPLTVDSAAWAHWPASLPRTETPGAHPAGPQAPSFEIWADRELEGGFVSMEYVRSEPNLPPDEFSALREHFIEPFALTPPNGLLAPRDPTPPDGDWLRSPIAHQRATRLVGLTLDLLPISEEISMPSEGGFVQLPAYNLALVADWQVDWAGPERLGSAQAGEFDLTGTDSMFDAARNDASHTAVLGRDLTRPNTLENTIEGGFVDVGIVPDTLSSLSGRSGRISTGKSLWDSAEQDVLDSVWTDSADEEENLLWDSERQDWDESIWSDLGREYGSVYETDIAGDDDPQVDEHSASDDESDESAQRFHRVFYGEEGGMIELGAVSSTAASSRAQAVASATDSDDLSLEAKDIRMDKGVGRFQAFELATVPAQYVAESDMTSAELTEPVRPAVETASTSTSDAPPTEASASASRERSEPLVHRAATLPTIVLLASLATAIDAVPQEATFRDQKPRSRSL